ncbi:hypothetical protein KRR38_11210 [Novosphingobium sp. G106]|uniref:hypothetical protein n=1 Tax=Novosphingobium sp. G106 TaxID=2849500 RepID=UPI001C2CF7F3|nr:hypothetical protein [Novosphingobium sp. G106]MBV1688227.1 hypothetical protein [Novosphingobium sp. G106]
MNHPVRSMVPAKHFQVEEIAPGVSFRRLYPGGMLGPDEIVRNDIPGGQTWSEIVMLGTEHDDFIMGLPDIRLPPNQIWPMHWHDCWTVVVVLEGGCLIGDWYMETGDVFVAAPSIEYGPLVIGAKGCRMLEIFGDLALSPGGYGPEYRDHPTLTGNHVFKPREGINKRNEGHSSLTLEGTEGMWKTRLAPGWSWDLGEAGDPNRAVIRDTRLAAGETIAARSRGDWYAALVLDGSVEVAGRTFVRDDVLVVERGSSIPDVTAGSTGVHLLEHFRTARAL